MAITDAIRFERISKITSTVVESDTILFVEVVYTQYLCLLLFRNVAYRIRPGENVVISVLVAYEALRT